MNEVTATATEATPAKASDGLIEVRVTAIRYAARDTNLYEFTRLDGKPLPAYEPGAHIDLHLPNGLIRQYSLINAEPDPATYTVGIKRDPASRGGSRYVHDELRVGKTLKISAPRNNFAAGGERQARRAVRRRHRHHADLVHGAAAGAARPLLDALLRLPLALRHGLPAVARSDGAGAIPFRRREPRASSSTWRRSSPRRRRTRISIAAGRRRCSRRSRRRPRIGRASRSTSNTSRPSRRLDKKGGFVVELARSGQEFVIPEGKSILQVLLDAGVDVDYSCELGICGACEQRVISGTPEHRDAILTEEEQASNTKVMICCAGCKSDRLVLDL